MKRFLLFALAVIVGLPCILALGLLYVMTHPDVSSYRYKLTLTLDTPDGVKTGYDVVEQEFWGVSLPMRGTAHRTVGQAIYIDMEPGHPPLIALMGRARRTKDDLQHGLQWGMNAPTHVLDEQCLDGKGFRDGGNIESTVSALNACNKVVSITNDELPDLVTFPDPVDHDKIVIVDPDNLEATFGPGFKWKSRTLQVTKEPMTTDIEKRMPWMNGYQHIYMYRNLDSVATHIGYTNFISKD